MMYLSRIEINVYRKETRKALDSPQIMHASVMASFPSIYNTNGQRVLWRIDKLGPSTYLIIQSDMKPDLSHMVDQFGWPESGQKWDTLDYSKFLEKIDNGQYWRFRLVANPVHSVSLENGKRGKRMAHVTAEQQIKWLLERCEKNGFAICSNDGSPEVILKDRHVLTFDRSGHKVTISYAVFEGVLEIKDADMFRNALKNGIGREKAYGCGLISLSR